MASVPGESIHDKNAQMHIFIVSFSYLNVNILDANPDTNFWSTP